MPEEAVNAAIYARSASRQEPNGNIYGNAMRQLQVEDGLTVQIFDFVAESSSFHAFPRLAM